MGHIGSKVLPGLGSHKYIQMLFANHGCKWLQLLVRCLIVRVLHMSCHILYRADKLGSQHMGYLYRNKNNNNNNQNKNRNDRQIHRQYITGICRYPNHRAIFK